MAKKCINLINLSRRYLHLRHTSIGEERATAHNQLMREMHDAGIIYRDREHAAEIAYALVVLEDANVLDKLG